jgi:hypothetical protein
MQQKRPTHSWELLGMSEADLRKQSRYTWMLVAFTVAVMFLMLKQSRATAESESAKPAVTHTAGLIIETGSSLR